jgi:hypothetical protein
LNVTDTNSTTISKDRLLSCDDESLKRECRFEACRGTGPGGQKRNKTSSAARLTHIASGISAMDDVTRSQHKNLQNALWKLRLELAVNLPPDNPAPHPPTIPLEPVPGCNAKTFAAWAGQLFDQFQIYAFEPSPVAAAYGCTPGRLLRLMGKNPAIWQHFAQCRQRRGLPPLHA